VKCLVTRPRGRLSQQFRCTDQCECRSEYVKASKYHPLFPSTSSLTMYSPVAYYLSVGKLRHLSNPGKGVKLRRLRSLSTESLHTDRIDRRPPRREIIAPRSAANRTRNLVIFYGFRTRFYDTTVNRY